LYFRELNAVPADHRPADISEQHVTNDLDAGVLALGGVRGARLDRVSDRARSSAIESRASLRLVAARAATGRIQLVVGHPLPVKEALKLCLLLFQVRRTWLLCHRHRRNARRPGSNTLAPESLKFHSKSDRYLTIVQPYVIILPFVNVARTANEAPHSIAFC